MFQKAGRWNSKMTKRSWKKNEFGSFRGEMQRDFVARILSSKVIAATGSLQEGELSPEGPFTLNMFSSACTQSLVTNQQKACWCFSFRCHIPTALKETPIPGYIYITAIIQTLNILLGEFIFYEYVYACYIKKAAFPVKKADAISINSSYSQCNKVEESFKIRTVIYWLYMDGQLICEDKPAASFLLCCQSCWHQRANRRDRQAKTSILQLKIEQSPATQTATPLLRSETWLWTTRWCPTSMAESSQKSHNFRWKWKLHNFGRRCCFMDPLPWK